MASKINHLETSRVVVGTLRESKAHAHALLADVYLVLTRDLTEDSRTQALHNLNEAMTVIRKIDESIDYLQVSNKGIDEDLAAVAATIRDMRAPAWAFKASTDRDTVTGTERF